MRKVTSLHILEVGETQSDRYNKYQDGCGDSRQIVHILWIIFPCNGVYVVSPLCQVTNACNRTL